MDSELRLKLQQSAIPQQLTWPRRHAVPQQLVALLTGQSERTLAPFVLFSRRSLLDLFDPPACVMAGAIMGCVSTCKGWPVRRNASAF